MLNYQRVIVIIYPDMDERLFLAPGGSPYHLAMRSGASWDDQTINKSRVFYPVSHPPKRMFLKKYRGFAGQGSNHISAAGSARSSLCTSERYAANCLCLWRRLETFQVSLYTVSWLVVTFFIFPYWEFHHPNWLIFFQRGWNHQPVRKKGFESWWFCSISWYTKFRHLLGSPVHPFFGGRKVKVYDVRKVAYIEVVSGVIVCAGTWWFLMLHGGPATCW